MLIVIALCLLCVAVYIAETTQIEINDSPLFGRLEDALDELDRRDSVQ